MSVSLRTIAACALAAAAVLAAPAQAFVYKGHHIMPTPSYMAKLAKIEGRASHCPYKGVATYWALAGGDPEHPVAWAYETPYPEVSQLAGHIAFYQDRVTVSLGVAIFPHPKKG